MWVGAGSGDSGRGSVGTTAMREETDASFTTRFPARPPPDTALGERHDVLSLLISDTGTR